MEKYDYYSLGDLDASERQIRTRVADIFERLNGINSAREGLASFKYDKGFFSVQIFDSMWLSRWLLKVYWANCDVLPDLVPFVQFKKRRKHQWRSDTSSKVAGISLQLSKSITPSWVFFLFSKLYKRLPHHAKHHSYKDYYYMCR